MSNIKEIQQIKTLIAQGKKKGFLTFDEVNKALPAEINKPEQIEEIIGVFDQLNIAIVDTEKDAKSLELVASESDEDTVEAPVADLELIEWHLVRATIAMVRNHRSILSVLFRSPACPWRGRLPKRPGQCSG